MYNIFTFHYFAEFVRSTDFSEISFCALLAPFFDFFLVEGLFFFFDLLLEDFFEELSDELSECLSRIGVGDSCGIYSASNS